MINLIKKWIDAIRYPVPLSNDPEKKWREFAKKACFERVAQVFDERKNWCFFSKDTTILSVILKRLARGNWPKLSSDFVKRNSEIILKVKSYETAKDEVRIRYDSKKVMYLVDKSNQMLGIVVDENTIITGIVSESIKYRIAKKLSTERRLATKEELKRVVEKLLGVNRLLENIGHSELCTSYWVRDGLLVMKCFFSGTCPPAHDDDAAKLLFFM